MTRPGERIGQKPNARSWTTKKSGGRLLRLEGRGLLGREASFALTGGEKRPLRDDLLVWGCLALTLGKANAPAPFLSPIECATNFIEAGTSPCFLSLF
ncbi:hypothetical protein [Metabacillus sp. 84]|uniref:hypothetical protein n=1 Tax=Metabacillus sp. 84 TaxID=3404705 RepID=UPI003CEEF16B